MSKKRSAKQWRRLVDGWQRSGLSCKAYAEQVGVKAPGKANRTTFLSPNSSWLVSSAGPSGVMWFMTTSGTLSPMLMVIVSLPLMVNHTRGLPVYPS